MHRADGKRVAAMGVRGRLVRGRSKRLGKRADADRDQHNADRMLGPRGNGIDRQNVARDEREQAHRKDAGAMANAPAHADSPCTRFPFHCVRRDRGEVIGPRQYVQEACDETRKQDGDAHGQAKPAWRRARSSRRRERGVRRMFQFALASSSARRGRRPRPMKNAAAWSA